MLLKSCRFCRHNSHCSHSPLILRLVSAIVLGFRAYSHRCWRVLHHTDHYTYRLRRVSCSDNFFASTTMIVLPRSIQSWKSRNHRSTHTQALPKEAAPQSCASCIDLDRSQVLTLTVDQHWLWPLIFLSLLLNIEEIPNFSQLGREGKNTCQVFVTISLTPHE